MDGLSQPKRRWKGFFLAFCLGSFAVVGAGAAVQATDNAEFCGSCHSMNPAVFSFTNSVHAQLTCNDCHTPSNLVSKLPYKAKVGLHDIYVTLTDTAPNRIHASAEMKSVIQQNCLRCHGSTIQGVDMTSKQYCTDCHRSVPHNGKRPMAEREAADV